MKLVNNFKRISKTKVNKVLISETTQKKINGSV